MDYEQFYLKDSKTNKSVSFDCVNDDGQIIDKYSFKQNVCFSTITYGPIPKNCIKVLVFHKLKEIPYSQEIILKWIEEIDNFGFKCSVSFKDEKAIFSIALKDFNRKILVNCTLILIRALFETGICHVPSYYFTILKANPKFNQEQKFNALQDAHILVYKEYLPNANHMCVYNGLSPKNITLEKLMKNIDKTGIKVYDDAYTGLSRLWINN